MFSIFTQKKTKSKDRRLKDQYKELNKAIGTLGDLGVSEQEVADFLDDSCAAAAAAAPATFDDDMVKK